MSDRIDALIAYLAEHGEQARHHESQRSNWMLAGLGFAGAIGALAGGAGTGHDRLVAGLSILFVGMAGALFSMKSYERNRFHVTMIEFCRQQIDAELLGKPGLAGAKSDYLGMIRKAAEEKHYSTFKLFGSDDNALRHSAKSWIARQRLNRLWMLTWTFILLAGVLVTLSSRMK